MAERRMFAKTIVMSDAFLDMDFSARCLYHALGMVADDDGFVNNPNGIARQIGASKNDIDELVRKRFIIAFDSGVIAIKHWRINNYLQKDRYKESTYKKEKAMLTISENGSYTEKTDADDTLYTEDTDACIQGTPSYVYKVSDTMYTQDRVDKLSIDKHSIGKGSKGKESAPAHTHAHEDNPAPTAEDVIHAYNDACVCLPPLRYITDIERSAAEAILQKYTLDQLKEAFCRVEASDLLTGRKEGATWRANFMWIVKEERIKDILNGKYDSWRKPTIKPTPATDSNSTFDVDDFYARTIEHTYGKVDAG